MQITGYQLQDKIYESARSVVFLGKRLADDQTVIIKFLNEEFPDPVDVAKLKREHELLNLLDDPGIVRSHEFVEHENSAAIIMEDVGGSSLSMVLKEQPDGLELKDFLFVARHLARILGKIHQKNVVHKDINPANVVWNREKGKLKIIDFGISSLLSRESTKDLEKSSLEGTLSYISPEQTGRMNRNVDWRTDIYSLGVTFYELLLGRVPFEAEDAMGFVHAHMAKVPKAPVDIDPNIPEMLSEIVLKCMAKTAEDRYQSAYGLERDLERCAASLRDFGSVTFFEIGADDLLDTFRIPEKLYGREGEIKTLYRSFERIRLNSPQLVLVTGYSGIGKSSVVNELYKPVTREKGFFAKGKFDQMGRVVPYFALIEAFRQLTSELLTESESIIEVWRERFLSALGPNGKIIADVVPEIVPIIGEQPEVESLLPTEEQNRFKLVFQSFLRVFAREEHPLVLFLDDLQWADTASLNLLGNIISNPENNYLLIIGAYRVNEVDGTHPLSRMLDRLTEQDIEYENLSIEPLLLEDVEALISDTLGETCELRSELAQISQDKTGGNPFFLSQFLETLYREELIFFGAESRQWECNLAGIRSKKVTDNVVDLMGEKIHRLSDEARECVRMASCIGDKFELKTLATAIGQSPKVVATKLEAALQEGLITPLSDAYKYVGENTDAKVRYGFLHDKVRQAAYALIEEEEKQRFHLNVGRLLRAGMTDEEQQDGVFALVHHFVVGRKLITDTAERKQVAALCLAAGERAKHAAAYDTALSYLDVAADFSDEDWWETDYDLVFAICHHSAEAAFLSNEKDKANAYIDQGLAHVKNLFDEIKLNEVKYLSLVTTEQRTEGIKIAIGVLKKLGQSLPYKPSPLRLLAGLISTKMMLWGKDGDSLRELPELTEPELIEAKRHLMIIASPTYLESKELWLMLVLMLMKLNIKHGESRYSPVGYVGWAVVSAGVFGDYDQGYAFGKLAVDIMERHDEKRLRSFVSFVVNNFIFHWKDHLKVTLEGFLLSYQAALEIGDYVYAGHAAANYCYHSFYLGKNLRELEKELQDFGTKMPQFDNRGAHFTLKIYHQTVLNLLGETEDPRWIAGEIYDQNKELEGHREREEYPSIWDVYNLRALISYLLGDYQTADECQEESLRIEEELAGIYGVSVVHFMNCLIKLARYRDADRSTQRRLLKAVARSQKRLKKWAGHCESNFLHKLLLVEAEIARVTGRDDLAPGLYERAIQGAEKEGFLHEQAIALELAGTYNLEKGHLKIARYYLQDAFHCYKRWGAEIKVSQMQEKYKELLIFADRARDEVLATTRTITRTATGSTQTLDAGIALDFHTLMKSSLTISEEIVFDKLLKSLLEILVENAGAQRCFLVMEDNSELYVECSIDITKDFEHRPSIKRFKNHQDAFSLAVVLYVYRTHETVVLGDAVAEEKFGRDEYITKNQPKSVLSMPILKQGELVGILYMENNETTDAFTSDRIEVLNVLTAQAAISIENARLYSRLKESKEQLEVALGEARESARIKTEFLARTSHELRTPLNTIINMPLIMADSFLEVRIARCQKCQAIFEIDRNEDLAEDAACPECEAANLGSDEHYHLFEGDTEALYQRLYKVSRSGENLLAIIDDILDVNNLDTERAQHTQGKVVLFKVLDEIKESFAEKAKMRGVSFDIGDGASEIVFVGNREKVQRILANIIGNAVKFSKNDSAIVIGADVQDDNVLIWVKDNGPGIPDEHLVRIFESFHQVQAGSTRSHGGTGLGLTIAQKLVQHHLGQIWAESSQGAGAIFYVKLPRNGVKMKTGVGEKRVSINAIRDSIL